MPWLQLESNFANFASFVIIVILAGLFIGEGVHTLAEIIELMIFWSGQWTLHSIFRPVKVWMIDFYYTLRNIDPEEGFQPDGEKTSLKSLFAKCVNKISEMAIIGWFVRRVVEIKQWLWKWLGIGYWWLHFIFKHHRQLFANMIEWNFNPEHGPWSVGQQGELYQRFARCFKKKFETEIRNEPDPGDLRKLYPLITSQLSQEETMLSQRFQAIFSFCRSMWVTSFIITIGYVWVLLNMYPNSESEYIPLGVDLLPSEIRPITIPLVTLLATFAFLISTGKYKRHFVEYLMSDFSTSQEDIPPDSRSAEVLED